MTKALPASLLLLSLIAGPSGAATQLETVAEGLIVPVALTHAEDGRLFVTSLLGEVRIVEGGQVLPTPFLDIKDRVTDRGGFGLWSVAFHPEFPAVPHVFAHYVEEGTGDSVISRFELSPGDPNRALATSEVVLLRIPKTVQLHYGGQLAFGPDGFLYVSTGDGTDGSVGPDPLCLAQSLDTLEGKLLRLDVTSGAGAPPYYSIPPDNPFPGGPSPEIWGYGLRNPWRFSFDGEVGDLWLSDVGQNRREEVTRLPAGSSGGANFGWKIMEGGECFSDLTGCGLVPPCNSPALTQPTVDYAHGLGRCSVIGGYVYRGSLVPELYGRYLYGDFCTGEIWSADESGASILLTASLPSMATFGEDAAGELYLIAEDKLFRLVDPDVPAAGVLELTATRGEVGEGAGALMATVRRVGEGQGAVTVQVSALPGTASAGEDFTPVRATLSWADGDLSTRTVTVPITDDTLDEPVETLRVEVSSPTGGAILGARRQQEITILDDDICATTGTQLCLNEGRFRVNVSWRSSEADGEGQAEDLTNDSGYFWFFGPDNPEIFVKILDACVEPFNHYWVFLAGLTNVETRVEVVDTESGQVRVYETALGQGFEAVRDTSAFATCP